MFVTQRQLRDANPLRHRWEMRLVYLGAVMGVVWLFLLVGMAVGRYDIPDWLSGAAVAMLSAPFVLVFFLRYNYWKEIVNAVEVTDQQYPEIWAIYIDLVRQFELDETPRLYVKNGNGLLNAFAAKCTVNKAYVLVYSDIVDSYYELGDKDTLRFVLGHELGHVRLGHVNIRRQILKSALRPLFLTNSLTRAQEYSADRIAASKLVPEVSAARSLSILYAGKRNYQALNIDQYVNNDTAHISRFWVAVVNFMANHPVGRRRLAAASKMDADQHWDVHGPML